MAINLLSPGVKITESDQVASIAATGATIGGFVGQFRWGPIDQAVLVTGESQLVRDFAAPNSTNAVDFLTAANFLAYSGSEYVVRVANTALNATSNANATILVENDDAYEGATLTTAGLFVAKYAGALGNSLLVSVCEDETAFATWDYASSFDAAPGTSDYADARGGADDEIHVIVVDEDGEITGVAGTVLEKFTAVSKASDARGIEGGTNYYRNVINNTSKYIRWANHPVGGNWGGLATTTFTDGSGDFEVSLAGGTDGAAVTQGDRAQGYGLFANKANINVGVLITGQADATTINSVIALAEARKDCVVVFSPERADVVNNAGDEATDVAAFADTVTRSTYAIMDGNWKYQYDKYNDTYVYVPCNADVAGCIARVDLNSAPWFSPAGYANGRILNAVRLAWNPTEAERDTLYKTAVNPIFSQPGRGVVLFGDKTFTTKKTSFSRINVRRLFITIQVAIGDTAGDLLFEQNDASTRAGFTDIVSAYLRTVQGNRGITDFRVICDDTNNPEDVVNANEFIADIYVRPIASINFIQLNFVSVRGSAAFAELG
jgi:phage tail sheath protein FI